MEQSQKYYEVYRKARERGEPVARYIKPIVGKVCVSIIEPFEGTPTDVILTGDPADKKVDPEDIIVTCWTDFENEWFRKANKLQLDRGHIAPYTEEIKEQISVNEISDEEIKELLEKPYFAWKNRLDTFTSAMPVKRFLKIATEMNRPIGTIETIKDKLSELQKTDGDTQSN